MTPPVQPERPERPEMDDAPPLLGTWRNIYALVFGSLLLYVAIFTAVTWAFT